MISPSAQEAWQDDAADGRAHLPGAKSLPFEEIEVRRQVERVAADEYEIASLIG